VLIVSAAGAELFDLDFGLAAAVAGTVVLVIMLADSAIEPHNFLMN